MKLHFPNLVQTVRILVPAFAFMIVLVIGGLMNADPLVLLGAALVVYVVFVILGSMFAGILGRLNHEVSDEHLSRADQRDKFEKSLGKMVDFSQSAELPHDRKARY